VSIKRESGVQSTERLTAQIVVQVTPSTKLLVQWLYPAYGLNSEAALIRLALARGKTLEELAAEVGYKLT
jgi:hypothetical protein